MNIGGHFCRFVSVRAIYRKTRFFYYSYIKAWFVYRKTSRWNILDSWQTINYLLEHKCSFSRYGDGEFGIIGGEGNGFQNADCELAKKLTHILLTDDVPNFMVGIPHTFISIKGLLRPRAFWPGYISQRYRLLSKIINPQKQYLDSLVTRFYFQYVDKSRCQEHVSQLRHLWDNQEIVIVEGHKTRSGVGNNLYDNAASVHRIIGYSENSFNFYNEMFEAITKNVSKDKLILLCYGMTATVLAYDLAKNGYWAVDLGHLDIEYEWMLMGAKERAIVIGKQVNELKEIGGSEVAECLDPTYQSQIICDITKKDDTI